MRSTKRELVWEVVDDEAMIVDVTTGDYFSLNGVATDVWTGLHAGHRVDDIVDTVASKYGADRSTVERDVADLVDELAEIGLWST